MKLWYSPPSPFARKVRAAAIELGLAERIELVLTPVVPIDPNPALIAQNPLVKLPTLEAEDGTVLYDSRTICEYLDALAGGGRLFPAS
ncbi:MAG: glutathione S-transferase N-terminal domain-containing protein, partial [Betaproteobacteria bacterium]|nr:glutathione S-transferase N-terminal domain-containing protein [Betaproteobacteria bacterium]